MKYTTQLIFLLSLSLSLHAAARSWQVISPDGRTQVSITHTGGKLTYAIARNDEPVIEKSPLGIDREDETFSNDLKIINADRSLWKDSFTLLVGKQRSVQKEAQQLSLTLSNNHNKRIIITFRVFNDGVAYQYHFPDKSEKAYKIIKEHSGFTIPQASKAFIQPYDLNVRNKPCYETYYENGIPSGSQAPKAVGWAFPALFQTGNFWSLITEAALDPNYVACHLQNSGNTYSIRFPEKEEVTSSADPEPISTLPWTTPWRVIAIGNSLDEIVGSSLVQCLNPPSLVADTSWIKPGRASWSWWSNGATTRSFAIQKEYVDFNAEMGWEYVLIDAGWPELEGGSIAELVDYATSKGVGIFLWYHSGMGRENDTLSMANCFAFKEERRNELKKIKEWGVSGIKVDFFDSDKQPVIQRYFDILQDAAEFKLMVNFHGSTLPRGWERTFPHLVSMESVKGAEGYGRQDFCDRAPIHNTILPFTRNVVGSMDYTPVTFTFKREAVRRTTFGHELALSVVFESGAFHFADRLNIYRLLPDAPKQFLMNVPVAWDESHVVAGYPGKYVVMARRNGDTWYIGGINGQDEKIEIQFKLPGQQHHGKLNIITDGEVKGSFASYKGEPTNGTFTVTCSPHGGFVATLE